MSALRRIETVSKMAVTCGGYIDSYIRYIDHPLWFCSTRAPIYFLSEKKKKKTGCYGGQSSHLFAASGQPSPWARRSRSGRREKRSRRGLHRGGEGRELRVASDVSGALHRGKLRVGVSRRISAESTPAVGPMGAVVACHAEARGEGLGWAREDGAFGSFSGSTSFFFVLVFPLLSARPA